MMNLKCTNYSFRQERDMRFKKNLAKILDIGIANAINVATKSFKKTGSKRARGHKKTKSHKKRAKSSKRSKNHDKKKKKQKNNLPVALFNGNHNEMDDNFTEYMDYVPDNV